MNTKERHVVEAAELLCNALDKRDEYIADILAGRIVVAEQVAVQKMGVLLHEPEVLLRRAMQELVKSRQ